MLLVWNIISLRVHRIFQPLFQRPLCPPLTSVKLPWMLSNAPRQLLCSSLNTNQERTIWTIFMVGIWWGLMEKSCTRGFVGDAITEKTKQSRKLEEVSFVTDPWSPFFDANNSFCYKTMETYLSEKEDESPFRNSGDRISSTRRLTMSEKLGRCVLSLCQHSIIKLWTIFGHPCTNR